MNILHPKIDSSCIRNRLPSAILFLIFACCMAYYIWLANYVDISFDGAIFCQPVVTLEQHGILSHTYNVEHTTEFRFPLTNLGQGMLSQFILNWPFIHFWGINHFTLQISNLIFLTLTAILLSWTIIRLTGNCWMAVLAIVMFFTVPGLRQYGLQGYGEIAAAFYLLAVAYLLYLALSDARYYPYLGLVLFLVVHTKNYLFIAYPLLVVILGYLALCQKAVKVRDILRMSVAFFIPITLLVGLFLTIYGSEAFKKEMSDYWVLFASDQWGNSLGAETRSWHLVFEAFTVLGSQHGGWPLIYIPIVFGYALAIAALVQGNLRRHLPVFNREQTLILFLFALSVFYIGYWFHFSTFAIWYRRLIPFLIIDILLFILAAYVLWQRTGSYKVRVFEWMAALAVFSLLGLGHISICLKERAHFELWHSHLIDRIDATDQIRKLPVEAKIFGIGWWQAPALSCFSGRHFLDLYGRKGTEYSEGYLVVDNAALNISLDEIRNALAPLQYTLLWSNSTNRLYRWERKLDNVAETPLAPSMELLKIGPEYAYTDGTQFYKMQDGTYAMWAKGFNVPSSATIIMWENRRLTSICKDDTVTATVPTFLFVKPGKYNISLYNLETQTRSNAISITIANP